VDLARTLTLGRQQLFGSPAEIARAFADHGRPLRAAEAERWLEGPAFAEPLLERLGGREVDSLDSSGFEGATIVHDLNEPVPDRLHGRFTCVFDGGTLEHVFGFSTALRSSLRMVAVGGHFLSITPFDGYAGHGFYQMGPELPYRVFAAAQGFALERVLICDDRGTWFAVADPAVLRRRPALPRDRPTLMYVQAQRVAAVDPLARAPQESDYAAAWSGEAFGGPQPDDAERFLTRTFL
jgi:hypothetical protein